MAETTTIKDTKTSIRVKYPKMYKVIIFNDNITHFDFVIQIISFVFNKTIQEASLLTVKIHKEGKAIIEIYPKNVAEGKRNKVLNLSKNNGYPLKCEIEVEQ